MSVVITELETELTTDPDGLGYSTLISNGEYNQLRDVLNEPRSQYTVRRESIPMSEIYAQVDWTGEWLNLTATKREGFSQLTSTPNIDASSQNVVDAIEAIFGNTSTTWNNLAGIVNRDASRAEDLFGIGVSVTTSEIIEAIG